MVKKPCSSAASHDDAKLNPLALLVDRLAQTTKRLEKSALVGALWATLGDSDLQTACHLLAAAPFPAADRRRLNLGTAQVLGALSQRTGLGQEELRQKLVSLGDLTLLAESSLPDMNSHLSLRQLGEHFAAIAALSRPAERERALSRLLEECSPKEARVVIGVATGELRVGLGRGLLEDALARCFDCSLPDIQWAHMLTGDLGRVAVLARHRRLGEAEMTLFCPLHVMLATPVENAQATLDALPSPFVAEDKFDGIRLQVHVGKEAAFGGPQGSHLGGQIFKIDDQPYRVALFSRTQEDITASFPELLAPLAKLASAHRGGPLILDGELLAVDGARARPFLALQKRLGRKKVTERMQQEVQVALVVFDLLLFENTLLIQQPWEQRRHRLEQLGLNPPDRGQLRCAHAPRLVSPEALGAAFAEARARGHEGLIIKHPQSPYRPGRRGRDWLKMKLPQATLDVVVTAVEVGHGRRRDWLSDYTFAVRAGEDDDQLLNVGKAYSGLTDREIETMTQYFKDHTLEAFAHGRVRRVEPTVVIEIACDRVQESRRHKSGFALRFARIIRLRPDKQVGDIDTLATVRALAQRDSQ